VSVNTKAAWGRIRERLELALAAVDAVPAVERSDWLTGAKYMSRDYVAVSRAVNALPGGPPKSILDEVQAEYRQGRITEPERDAMRAHVKTWLGDPDQDPASNRWSGEYEKLVGYATYSCGLWAPSAAPDGADEFAIILATLVILEEEDTEQV